MMSRFSGGVFCKALLIFLILAISTSLCHSGNGQYHWKLKQKWNSYHNQNRARQIHFPKSEGSTGVSGRFRINTLFSVLDFSEALLYFEGQKTVWSVVSLLQPRRGQRCEICSNHNPSIFVTEPVEAIRIQETGPVDW